MNYLDIDLNRLKKIITEIAEKELLSRFTKISHQVKADGSIVTEADLQAQSQIIKALKIMCPDILLLGEEMTIEEQENLLFSDQPVWCLDPLDGTSNFASGIPYFAVSLSLLVNAKVVLALVYDPLRKECFIARVEKDGRMVTTLNDEPLQIPHSQYNLAKATAVVDFKRLSNELATRIVTERPFSSQRNFGASALDWCWLAAGRGQVYLHGNQNLWDYAGGELIYRAAGGFCCTLDGEPIYKQAIEKRSIVASNNKALFDEWTNWLGVSVKLI